MWGKQGGKAEKACIGRAGVITHLPVPFVPRRKSQPWKKGQVLITFHYSSCGGPAHGMYLERGYGFRNSASIGCVRSEEIKLQPEEHLGTFPGALCDQPGFVLAGEGSGMSQGGSTHC